MLPPTKRKYDPKLRQFKINCSNYIKNWYRKRGGKDPDIICSHLAGLITGMKIMNQISGLPMDCDVVVDCMKFVDALETEVYLANGGTEEELLEGAKQYDLQSWG